MWVFQKKCVCFVFVLTGVESHTTSLRNIGSEGPSFSPRQSTHCETPCPCGTLTGLEYLQSYLPGTSTGQYIRCNLIQTLRPHERCYHSGQFFLRGQAPPVWDSPLSQPGKAQNPRTQTRKPTKPIAKPTTRNLGDRQNRPRTRAHRKPTKPTPKNDSFQPRQTAIKTARNPHKTHGGAPLIARCRRTCFCGRCCSSGRASCQADKEVPFCNILLHACREDWRRALHVLKQLQDAGVAWLPIFFTGHAAEKMRFFSTGANESVH